MRRAEPLEPEKAAALAAIDATLGGEPVDPEHAELAELALILRAERPAVPVAVASAIDDRVAVLSVQAPGRRRPRWPARRWLAAPAAALAAGALAAVVVTAGGGGGASSSATSSAAALSTTSASSGAGSAGAASSASQRASAPAAKAPGPTGTGKRQVVQSARLLLSAAPRRIDAVAQQVFDVVDSEKGIVRSSHVTSTGGPDGSARFALSVPVGNLQRTVSDLSQLRGAHLLSRSDNTTDVTGQVGGAGQRLAEARALRRSLLRQLAAAISSQAIASLQAQLRGANAAIARAATRLTGLQRTVDYSSLDVTIQASSVPPAPRSQGGGFTLERAVHDAGRVLVVVAGVGLIALAVLVPLTLVVALLAWTWLRLARRRREAMLDVM